RRAIRLFRIRRSPSPGFLAQTHRTCMVNGAFACLTGPVLHLRTNHSPERILLSTSTASTPAPTIRTGGIFLFIALAVASGLLLCVQSRINGALAAKLGDAIAASTISFGVGLVALILLALLVPAVRSSVRQVPRALA